MSTLAFENRYRTNEGDYRLLSWTAVPEGGFIHAVARDVTRERATEDALRQSQKLEAIGQLTGGVAHDFNNELAVIRTSLDLLVRMSATDERRARFMESISNSVTRASRLTSQLLAFARRQALQPTVFDAAQQVRTLNDVVASLAGERIAIALDLPRQGCSVFADPNQFATALVNLAANARDAMDGTGRLVVRVFDADCIPGSMPNGAPSAGFVAISVADTGCGIPPENLKRIFDPFFTTKLAGRGTGLGLSQVFGFAKQSGGDIQVTSEVGAGTVFTLYLPRSDQQATPARLTVEDEEPATGGGCCILVVEDNPEVSKSVQQTLQALDYSAVMTSTAEQALAELERAPHRFHAVFSDVVMPGMGGVELAQAIRRRHSKLPVVLSSGYSYVLSQKSDHGFTLLPKPYSLHEIARVLRGAIGQGSLSGQR